MPSKGDTQINTFVGGLVTESSPLTFPSGASLDEVNMKLNRDGSRERRLGLDFEEGFALQETGLNAAQLKASRQRFFRWTFPSGSKDVEIGVVQIGNLLSFVDLANLNPSAHLLNTGGVVIQLPTSNEVVFDFDIISNKLLVVSEELYKPILLSYDESTDTILKEDGFLNIRDTYGVQDDLGDAVRPTVLTDNHEYNLRNQGWHDNITTTCESFKKEALQCTFTDIGAYPSNSDTWTLGKIEDANSPDIDKFDPKTLEKNSFDLGRVARGHYVIDLYNRGASRKEVSGVLPTAADRELGRVSTVAAYAGRAFYSGIRSRVPNGDNVSAELSSVVLFSQVMESSLDLLKCYQKADPTSPEQSDIVDTDGGVIPISGAVNIVKLIPVKQSLFIFASNGVWELRGDDGGFKATAFQVNKLSSIGVFSRDSIVEANGTIFFWAKEGIFSLAPEQVSGSFEATSITLATIQKLYNTIPNLVKQNARGYYDVSENTVRWLYGSDDVKLLGDPIDILDPTPAVVQIGELVNLDNESFNIDVAALSATQSIITYTNGSNILKAVVLNVDGVVITPGTEVDLIATAFTATSVVRLTDTTAFVTYLTTGSVAMGAVITITGDAISIGTSVALATVNATPSLKAAGISSTGSIITFINATNDPCAQVISISGTTVTFGTVLVLDTLGVLTHTNIATFNATSGVVSYVRVGGFGVKATLLTISGLVITNATPVLVSATSATTTAATNPQVLSASSLIVTWLDAASIIKNSYVTITGGILTLQSTTSLTETGSIFTSVIGKANTQVITYADNITVFPQINDNLVGEFPVEGVPVQLAAETSFEYSSDKIVDKKVIIVYKNSSDFLRTLVKTI